MTHISTDRALLLAITGLLLVACSSAAPRKTDVWEFYDLHNSKVNQAVATVPGAAAPIDNDRYYRAPGAYSCNTIADLPSCPDD